MVRSFYLWWWGGWWRASPAAAVEAEADARDGKEDAERRLDPRV